MLTRLPSWSAECKRCAAHAACRAGCDWHTDCLLRSVCGEFWMVSRGGVEPFDSDLYDYQRYLLGEAKRQREAVKKARKTNNKA